MQSVGVTFIDLVRACYPVLIADDSGQWLGKTGTCFLVERGGRLFALTARHCVYPSSGAHLRIACHDKIFAPIRGVYQRTSQRELDSDEDDLYIIELDRARMSTTYQAQLSPVVINDHPPMHVLPPAPEPEICIPGFPANGTTIDYDPYVIAPKPTVHAAWYVGRGIEPTCHEIRFEENHDLVPSIDGFSGSPVFWVPTQGGIRYFCFVGMLLRGNLRTGFFLGAPVIIRGLDDVISQNPNG